MKKFLLALFLSILMTQISYSADTKLSDLDELATTPAASDELYINDGGTSKKIQYSNIMAGNAGTASALAANGANCSAGNSPLGVDASGAVESCFDVWTEAENTSAGYISSVASDSDWTVHGSYPASCGAGEFVTAIGDTLTCSTPAGSGDVTGVGDCASGACLDGSSDGGTYLKLYDGDSNYVQLDVGDLSGDVTVNLPTSAGTLLLTNGAGTSLTALDGENIQDDTIDDDSIDFSDVTGADLTLTDAGAITSSATITANAGLVTKNGSTSAGFVHLFEDSDDGTDKAILITPALTADVTLTLPNATGTLARTADNIATATALASNPDDCSANQFATTIAANGNLTCAAVGSSYITDGAIMNADINWDDMEDLTTSGAVSWGNLAEGELANSTVISDDIKDGTITGADLATNIAITSTGSQDYGGASSFEIPNAADPTIDAAGEIAVDTTSDHIEYYGSAKRVLTYKKEICFALEDPVDADDNVPFFFPREAITVTDVYCQVDGGTSVALVISDGTNALESITCDGDGAEDDGSIANGTFTSLERMEFDLDASSGTNTWLNVCVTYVISED